MKLILKILAFAILSATAFAQDITGTWQGTLQIPANAQRPATDLRIVFKITKADAGMKATMYSIDQAGAPAVATTVAAQGPTVKLSIPAGAAEYEGKLDSDGVNLIGNLDSRPGSHSFESETCDRRRRVGDSGSAAVDEADESGR